MTKICTRCNQELEASCFYKNAARKDGLAAQCKGCEKESKKSHYQTYKEEYIARAKTATKEKRTWLRELKKTLKCSRCPENHPACLQFHHLDPTTKSGNIGYLISIGWGKARLLAEMEKCEVVCSNCHFKEHWKEEYDGGS